MPAADLPDGLVEAAAFRRERCAAAGAPTRPARGRTATPPDRVAVRVHGRIARRRPGRIGGRAAQPDRGTAVSPIDELVREARIIVCCGSGGVGKTTTAAVIAMHAAEIGRRAVVVTIDPARRLADAMGLDGALEHAGPHRTRPGGDRRTVGDDARHLGDVRRVGAAARHRRRPRSSGSSPTGSTATSPVRSRAPRSTWRRRSCTSCTPTGGSTSS